MRRRRRTRRPPTTRCNRRDAPLIGGVGFSRGCRCVPAASFFDCRGETPMRAFILIAGAALTLAGCKNNDQHDNTQNVDENLTAENIVSNDVTAIDAVTGDAANMAADVDTNYGNLDVNAV